MLKHVANVVGVSIRRYYRKWKSLAKCPIYSTLQKIQKLVGNVFFFLRLS